MNMELKEDELEKVSGGAYDVRNNNDLYFQTITGKFHIKASCRTKAILEMDELINQFATEAEYDAACLAKLQELGYLE